jgi:porin
VAQPKYLRENLDTHGYAFQGLFIHDWSKISGYREDPSEGLGRYSLDVSVAVDGAKAFGWKGAVGLVKLKQHQKEFGGDYCVSSQLYSNIDAPSRTWLYEMWLEQTLLNGSVRLKGGKFDANSEFAVVQSATDFLNSSFAFSPTIVAFPSYPLPKLGAAASFQIPRGYAVNIGVLQTAGMGVMSIVEPQHEWSLRASELRGRASVGYWRLDGTVHGLGDVRFSSTDGVYAVVEQVGWRRVLSDGIEQTLTGFLQFGEADGEANAFTHHLGAGVVLKAPLSFRSQDAVGVAATWARLSHEPVSLSQFGAESAFEGYYKFVITRHLALVQDFQLLHRPVGSLTQADCFVITPRLLVNF